ncbi:DUF1877 family protein [Anabaena azotica FACHB-119]|uniref:DUF1877 family protein n=1 Tax=Anabaena azotica FACHB-119 TaxID=947527 RepID=A0ABR8D2G3_9NOST|nr:DUF1877 family protein [Anabaena azotica]MBD2500376.1 DUF1877 family protein [Anabaena azotica FACHB-119]
MKAYIVRVSREDGEKSLNSSKIVEKIIQNQSEHVLDLDESWYGIHFVMTGEYPIPKDEAQRRGISWDNNSLENVILGEVQHHIKQYLGRLAISILKR